LVLGW